MLKKAVCLMMVVVLLQYASVYGAVVADEKFESETALTDWVFVNLDEASGANLTSENGSMKLTISGDEMKQPFIQKNVQMKQGRFSADITIVPVNPDEAFPFAGTALNMHINGTEFFRVQPDSSIRARNYDANELFQADIEAGMPFHLDADFDTEAGTYNLYINGTAVNESPLRLNSTTDYGSGIGFFRIIFAGVGGAVYYADNIRIVAGTGECIIEGEAKVGETLNAYLDLEPDADIFWQIEEDGIFSDCGSGKTYTPDYGDAGKKLRAYAIINNRTVYSEEKEIKDNLGDLSIAGSAIAGQTLSAFADNIPDAQIKWQIGTDDNYIDCGEGAEYTLRNTDAGQYIRAYVITGERYIYSEAQLVEENRNLAYGAAATASNSLIGFDGEKLTDGSLSTRWASSEADNNTIKIDLGDSFLFNELVITEFEGRIKDYTLSVSQDDVTYNIVYTAENVPAGAMGAVTEIDFPAVKARYIYLDIPSSHTGPTIYEIEVFNNFEKTPVIYNAEIKGELSVGQTLRAVNDIYAVSDAEYSYQWGYEENGAFAVIDGENDREYIIEKNMLGKKIGVRIYAAYADRELYSYTECFADGTVQPPQQMAPYVRNIVLSDANTIGDVLTFTYDYTDVNDDAETNSLYRLIVSDTETFEVYTVGEEKRGTQAENIGFELKEEYTGKYIKISIIPVSSAAPETGTEYFSKEYIKPDGRPSCENVYILTEGLRLTGRYTYTHPDGYGEGESRYKWLAASTKNGEFHDTGISTQTFNAGGYIGKYIKFSVTPCDEKNGSLGSEKISDAVHVQASGGSGSSGGGGSSGGSVSAGRADNTLIKDTVTEKKQTFTDIEGHWAQSDIEYLAKIGIVNGVDELHFEPDREMKRSEAAALFAKAFEIDAGETEGFNDIAPQDWFYEAVTALASNNIIDGSDGCFYPDNNITRQEFSKIVCGIYYRSKNTDEEKAPPNDFMDRGSIAPWAEPYVNLCLKKGFMVGVTEELFMPLSYVTRAQAVTILARLIRQGVQ